MPTSSDLTAVGIVGSPAAGGRTRTAVAAVLSGASSAGVRTGLVELADASPDEAGA
jgi:multimeric flavodoxin WrbA